MRLVDATVCSSNAYAVWSSIYETGKENCHPRATVGCTMYHVISTLYSDCTVLPKYYYGLSRYSSVYTVLLYSSTLGASVVRASEPGRQLTATSDVPFGSEAAAIVLRLGLSFQWCVLMTLGLQVLHAPHASLSSDAGWVGCLIVAGTLAASAQRHPLAGCTAESGGPAWAGASGVSAPGRRRRRQFNFNLALPQAASAASGSLSGRGSLRVSEPQ